MNREWCNFVVYSNREVVVDRILADLEYWDTLEEKWEEFYVRYMVPEILSFSKRSIMYNFEFCGL